MQLHRARRPARATLAVAAAAGLVTALAVFAPASATPSTTVVISEVYGAGGNSGAVLTNDFVELQNLGNSAFDLSGYSVQYHSSSATGTWSTTALSGSIPVNGHWLIQEAGGANGTALPTPDNTGTLNFSGTSGTVALVSSTTALTCGVDCPGNSAVTDLIGYGTAAIFEGTAAAPIGTPTTSDQRAANGADTDNNAADFTAAAPTPTNSGTSGGGGGDQPGPLRIHDIQGDSWISPHNGDTVTNVPGIVTGKRTSSSKGFWMQDPNPDNDPATSEGIFVYTGSTPTVSLGDSVLVSGKVADYYPLSSGETTATTSSLSTTEIDSTGIDTVSTGNALPAPIVLGPDNVPDTYAPDVNRSDKNIEETTLQPDRSVLDFYESIEGMRVEADDARVVGPTDSFGEQYVTVKPNEDETYRGGTELLGENQMPSGRLEVVTSDSADLGLDVGDVLQGATVGEMDWSNFGGWTLIAQTVGTIQHNNLQPVTANKGASSQLSIATYNVENLAATDPDSKFQALAAGIVNNLAKPDIVALEEIQDNDGSVDDGVVAADQTLNKLIGDISAAGGPTYSYREIDPVDDQDGGEPGGNIRVAFLFNPDRVSFLDAGSQDVNRSTTGTQVYRANGQANLTLSPGRIDPQNPVWTSSRKPLVGEFVFRKKHVFVIANHWDAKLGDQNTDGRYQYPAQSSQTQRAGQAQVVHDFVQNILAANKNTKVVVLGDLNDYQFSTPLAALKTGTADGSGPSILTDLITTLPKDQQYTYVYDGVSEVLDHILVTNRVTGYTYQVVHVNSEYHDQTSDHDPQEVQFQP